MLKDAQCRAAKAGSKAYKLFDSQGLYLHVSTTGHRSWRHKYRYGGKEKLRTLGNYPEISLKTAREILSEEKRLLSQGKDPGVEVKKKVLANRVAAVDTFEPLALEWYARERPRWKPVHAADVITSLERDVFSELGALPITAIDTKMVLATLQKVAERGAIETAHRLRQRISAIFAYGIFKGQATFDPAASLSKVLPVKPPKRRWPAVITIEKARSVLALTDRAEATPIVKLASRFLALTAQRPGMVRWLRWDEIADFDPDNSEKDGRVIWTVPAAKLKQELDLRMEEAFDHSVPLASSAVDVLRQTWPLSAGSEYVFPGQRSIFKPMSENALSYLYLRMGLRGIHVPHGWRSTFLTIMNEWAIDNGGFRDPLILDLMLAHTPTGISPSELRYMRARFMDRRRKLATIWADNLLKDACSIETIAGGRRRPKS